MSKIKIHPNDESMHMFWDPAMNEPNAFYVRKDGSGWKWTGDFERPTVTPSILLTRPGYVDHLFISDGKIQYLNDCTHDLAGSTVDMMDFPEDW